MSISQIGQTQKYPSQTHCIQTSKTKDLRRNLKKAVRGMIRFFIRYQRRPERSLERKEPLVQKSSAKISFKTEEETHTFPDR